MKRYEVSWKMTGKLEVSAVNNEQAQELVSNMEADEIVKRSIALDWESTGATNVPWNPSNEDYLFQSSKLRFQKYG